MDVRLRLRPRRWGGHRGGHGTLPRHPARRTTYEAFEPAWSTRTVEDDPGAAFSNDTAKYVVSGTLAEATWRNTTIVAAYDPDAIRALKEEVDGDLYVSGSGTLVRAMLATAWWTSWICSSIPSPAGPVRGSSRRLRAASTLSLAACEAYENGVVYLAYRPR